MPDTQDARQDGRTASPPGDLSVSGTRLDPAHLVRQRRVEAAAGVPLAAQPAAAHQTGLADVLPPYRLQAEQLAELLRTRQHDLDRRESQLNARLAQFDEQLRGARLWLTEGRAELSKREADLDHREKEVNARSAQFHAAQEAHRQAAASHEARERGHEDECRRIEAELAAQARSLAAQAAAQQQAQAELETRREVAERDARRLFQEIDTRREASLRVVQLALDGLERRRSALEAAAGQPAVGQPAVGQPAVIPSAVEGPVERPAAQVARPSPVEDRSIGLGVRQEELEQAEALLIEGRDELARQRQELECLRERLDSQRQADRQWLADQRRRWEAELAAAKRSLERQNEQLDHRRRALEQTRDQVSGLHREALELRLATEELHVQLAGPAAPSALMRSLAALRERLAHHYALEAAELDQRKAELESLRADLASRHEKLSDRQRELRAWLAERQADCARQAERLAAREQELDEQKARFQGLEAGWLRERFGYQEQIRGLLGRLRQAHVPPAGSPAFEVDEAVPAGAG
ncbi:MAG: hypothetical protein WD847_21695 [Pirellulales bacterium]